jgi:hypothetical protein
VFTDNAETDDIFLNTGNNDTYFTHAIHYYTLPVFSFTLLVFETLQSAY